MVTKFYRQHLLITTNNFHNWTEVKRWPEVAGNYLQRRAALTGRLPSDRRRPAMVSFGAGGADFVGMWASKPKWWPELERPEMAPARVKSSQPDHCS
jgi:hypothetical protein